MEINKSPFVFQVDSDIVKNTYSNNDNFLVQYNKENDSDHYCVIYFCSNDIYYPNTEELFRKRIIDKNFFEWYNLRVQKACKHIFVRDIMKQWYLTGINREIDTPEKLLSFLQKETQDYRVITIGSSAGGYAAVLYGSLLHAEKVLTFNGQFEIASILNKSSEEIDPLVFRLQDQPPSKYYDLKNVINPDTPIYYFTSKNSMWDKEQFKHISDIPNIRTIKFKTSHHGIPFLKCNLPEIINHDKIRLNKLSESTHHPLIFSIKTVGLIDTFSGIRKQLIQAYKKRH